MDQPKRPSLEMEMQPYQSPPKNPQFPLLSELPVDPDARMPTESPIDKLVLEKTTPRGDDDSEEPIEKDLKPLITETNERLAFALNQSKHQRVVQQELKALLEHERKILVQVAERATKFSTMKEENKKKIDDWESEHNQRMPFYLQFLKELMEFPEDHCLTQEGVPTRVEQKILYSIVEKTSHVSNNAIVQLSMQNTLVNDIDLSLAKLRQFCAVMIKQIDNWLKLLNTQIEHQDKIVDLWEAVKQNIKEMKERQERTETRTGTRTATVRPLKDLEERVLKLENTVDNIQCCDPVRAPPSANPNGSPSPACSPQSPFSAELLQQRQFACPPRANGLGSPCPTGEDYLENICSPSSLDPPNCQIQQDLFPTGADYFGEICPPTQPPQQNGNKPLQCYDNEGRLQRSRAPPGQCQVDLLDAPGLGFPIPRLAMEKEGRPRGQNCPLTPPTPPPPQYGTFMPQAASSPQGPMRSPYGPPKTVEYPPNQCPALIPKIQEDLQTLDKKNQKLEELVNNFRKMRQLLTDEMEKAVKLNHKLQRDLHYVAQEASKPS